MPTCTGNTEGISERNVFIWRSFCRSLWYRGRTEACTKNLQLWRDIWGDSFHHSSGKKNDRSLQILLELQKGGFVYNKDFEESISVTRSEKNAKTLNVRAITLLESCVLNRSVPLVKRLLSLNVVPAGVESALRMSFENNLQEFQDVLLAFIINLCSGTGRLIHTISCAELAIVYDKPKVLEAIIKNIPNDKCNFGFWFSETCDALQRNECKDVLNKFRSSAVLDKPASQRMDKFLQVIEDFHGVETDTILASFHADKEFHSEFIKQYSESCSFPHIFRDSRKKLRDPRVIRALYKLGLDINAVDSYRNTALTYFLKNISPSCLPDRRFREILSVLIQENPDIELNATAVSIGIDSDMELAEKTFSKFKMVGEYICDGEEHLLYNSTFALNFIGPYLIECGFPHSITIRTLTAFEKTPLYLHPGELAYLRQCVEVPRKLALRCRDVLRKHFTGRKLHAFLELPIVPKKLEDFILIKSSCT